MSEIVENFDKQLSALICRKTNQEDHCHDILQDVYVKIFRNIDKVEKAKNLNIELCFLPSYSPNLNLIERMWKFVKKQCLYSKYYEKFPAFKEAISKCLDETSTTHKSDLDSLLTLRFQLFQKPQFVTA